ncbi:MAG: type I-U CRISPR-associated protein Csb2 [Methanotrichaceae archaeon]
MIISIKAGVENSFAEIFEEATSMEPSSAGNSFQGSLAGSVMKTSSLDNPTVARFSLSSRAPRLTEAILLAERIHVALVDLSDGSFIFTGCDNEGKPLKGHAHAYILSESNLALGRGRNGEITHVTVYAAAGFGPVERDALENLREIHGLDVQLILMSLGLPGDIGGLDVSRGECPLLAESPIWISRTPFISTRHPKATRAGVPKVDRGLQIGSPEHELRRLLRLEGFPEPVAVEPVSFTELAGRRVGWASFHRARSSGEGRRAGSAGYGFRIEFSKKVRGPVAVGYGAHFGMGGFTAEDNHNITDI